MDFLKGEAFLSDFAKRTLSNLEIIQNEAMHNANAYEVTQLINSLLAFIVFPYERNLNVPIEKIFSPYIIYPKQKAKNRNTYKKLRHAISHSHIFFAASSLLNENGKREIDSVIFVSCNYINCKSPCPTDKNCEKCKIFKSAKNPPDFLLKIPVTDLNKCVRLLANEIINATKTNQQGRK